MKQQSESWDVIVESKSSLFELNFKEVWKYKDLLWLLVRRDFISFYKQTVLGPFWFLIQPLFTVGIYIFIFSQIAGIPTDGIPQPLFYLTGIAAWTYFSDCVLKTSNVFRDNAHIFGKVYFPRLIMPLSISVSNLVKFSIQLLLIFIMITYYKLSGITLSLSPYLLFLPCFVVLMGLFGLGIGLIISSITIKYRDFSLLISFAITLLMYTCPVVYPLSSISGLTKQLVLLNPMTTIIEWFRFFLTGNNSNLTLFMSLYALGAVFFTFILGVIIFNKAQKNFIDTI